MFFNELRFGLNGIVNRDIISSIHKSWIFGCEWHKIGLFFENLIGDKYLDLLINQIIPAVQHNNQLPQHFWFQQDGWSPYYDWQVRNFLEVNFPNRWIGHRGFLEWTDCPLDINPLHFLFGVIEHQVITLGDRHAYRIRDIEFLRNVN